MPRITEFALLSRPMQHTLAISREVTGPEDLPGLIGGGFQKLGDYLDSLGELMTDNPYVAYSGEDGPGFSVEVGFTVLGQFPDKGEIKAGVIPAGRVVSCMYLGAYEEVTAVYQEMTAWAAAGGLGGCGIVYEYYYNGPDNPVDDYLTRIVMPVL